MDPAKVQFLFGDVPPGLDPDDPDDERDGDERAGAAGALYGPPEVGRSRADLEADIVERIVEERPPEVWAAARRLLDAGRTGAAGLIELAVAHVRAMEIAKRDDGPEFEEAYAAQLACLPLPGRDEMEAAMVAVADEGGGATVDEIYDGTFRRLGRAPDDPLLEYLLDHVFEQVTGAYGPLGLLASDRVVPVAALTGGIVLTHRLTEEERAGDRLAVGFDLAGFARTADPHLSGGEPLEEDWLDDGVLAWAGPDGWLAAHPAGSLVAVRVGADGLVAVTSLDGEPPPDPGLVARLRAVYDTEVEEPWLPVEGEDLVLGLLDRDRAAFGAPRPPLDELCAAAGLERRGDEVAHDETVWARARFIRYVHRIRGAVDDDDAVEVALDAVGAADPTGGDDTRPLAEVLRAMAEPRPMEPRVPAVVVDALLPPDEADGEAADRAARFTDALAAAATTPAELAVARFMAAVVAERSGDVLAAEAHLALALEADPAYRPALSRAAWYASDRGDAVTAVRLWRRLGDADPADLAEVEPLTRPGGRRPGRNEPCWCGSGRKYKTCHPDQDAPVPLPDRVGWLCRKAVAYLTERGGAAMSAAVAMAYARAVDPDDPESVARAVDDPVVLDAALTEGGWFERFLDDREVLLPDDEALLARAWTLVDRTVYEVVGVNVVAGVRVRDLRTGDQLDVRERTFSREAAPGMLVCARAVPDGETHQFVGAVLPVAPGAEAYVLDVCDAGDPGELCAYARSLYLPPVLETREGEPLVACTAVVDVGDPGVAAKVLDDRYRPEGGGRWVETPEERAATVTGIQDHLERRWVDEIVPALGGLTPRAAAADPTRRAELERLIAGFPVPEPGAGGFGMRPDRLRALLGLDGPSGR